MKKLIYILIAIITITLLSSCQSGVKSESVTCNLYYYENELREGMTAKKITFEKAPIDEIAEKLFSLLSSPESKKSIPILTPDIKLSELKTENGECSLTLSGRYLEISEQKRAEINACVTHTMCSHPDIERVTIYCEDKSYSFISDDFITASPRTHHNMFTANLYFANESADMLLKEERTISLESDKSREYLVLEELIAGPSDINASGILSERLKINDVQVIEGVCIIDLSADFVSQTPHTEIAENMAVYSIVNTMTELPMINSVRFLINGNENHGFEFIDISKPLTNKSDLISK